MDNLFLTIDYNERKQRTKVKDVIHDVLRIRNNVIQSIDFAIDPWQMIFFAECQILVMSSTTWHQRRVDNMFLTVDYNERKQKKKVQDVICDMLPL